MIDHIFVTLDKLLSVRTFLVNFLSLWTIFYQFFGHLSRLDSDMFLSIQVMFPCSGADSAIREVLFGKVGLTSICSMNFRCILQPNTSMANSRMRPPKLIGLKTLLENCDQNNIKSTYLCYFG